MKFLFDETHRKQELHKIKLDEDNLLFFADTLEGEDRHYILTGRAEIDGEIYHEFQIECYLAEMPETEEIASIMNCDWEWYDFVF